MLVSPNTRTFLELDQKESEILPWPFHRPHGCISDWSETGLELEDPMMSRLISLYGYRRSTCQALCRLKATLEACGCIHERFDELHMAYFLRDVNSEGQECIRKESPLVIILLR